MYETIVLILPTILMCLAFLWYVIENNNFAFKTNFLFCISSVIILLLTFVEAIKFNLPSESILSTKWMYAMGYILRTGIVYVITLISFRNYSKPTLLEFMFVLPLVFTVLFSVVSIYNGVQFSVASDGTFVYGPLYSIPFFACGIYFVLLAVLTVNNYRIKDYHEFAALISLISLCALSTVLEAAFHFRYVLGGTAIIAVAFYNMLLHNNTNSRDRLTGCPIRRRFYEDGNWRAVTALIMIDLNGLKRINDECGHAEGDRALCTLSSTVHSIIRRKNATLYRIGGDEFAILCNKMTENEVLAITYGIRAGMEETDYNCAIGYAMYDKKSFDFDDLCRMADAEMYKDKLILKK